MGKFRVEVTDKAEKDLENISDPAIKRLLKR